MQNLPEDILQDPLFKRAQELIAEEKRLLASYDTEKPLAKAMKDLINKKRAEREQEKFIQAMESLSEIMQTYPQGEPYTVNKLESHIEAHMPSFFELLLDY